MKSSLIFELGELSAVLKASAAALDKFQRKLAADLDNPRASTKARKEKLSIDMEEAFNPALNKALAKPVQASAGTVAKARKYERQPYTEAQEKTMLKRFINKPATTAEIAALAKEWGRKPANLKNAINVRKRQYLEAKSKKAQASTLETA